MASEARLRPDYTKSIAETFTRYATVLLDTPRGGAVLAYCLDSDRRPASLPSWVPDWSHEPQISQPMSDWTLYADDGDSSFYAAGGNPPSSSPSVRALNENLLSVRGFVLNTIAEVTDPAEHVDASDPEQSYALWLAWYRTLRQWQQRTQTQTKDAAQELFKTTWRLLMVDRDSSGLARASGLPDEVGVFDRAVLTGNMSAIEAARGLRAVRAWLAAAMTVSYGTRLCRTEDGMFGTVSINAMPGDGLAIVEGCPVPLVVRQERLRPDGAGGIVYRIMGRAYVDGIMDGEAVMGDRQLDERLLFA
jgi:hypothetical protein